MVRPALAAAWLLLLPAALLAETNSLGHVEFTELHRLIKPAPGESRWMEIAWYPSIWEARQQAAATGKPIFMMAGSGGAPAAGC